MSACKVSECLIRCREESVNEIRHLLSVSEVADVAEHLLEYSIRLILHTEIDRRSGLFVEDRKEEAGQCSIAATHSPMHMRCSSSHGHGTLR